MTETKQSIYAMLAELRTLAEAKCEAVREPEERLCKCGHYLIDHLISPGGNDRLVPCDCGCQEFSEVASSVYARLLNVVREECVECSSRGRMCSCGWPLHSNDGMPCDGNTIIPHDVCSGTGYKSRSWDGWPDGALPGALKEACVSLGWYVTWDAIDDQVVADVLDSESFTLAQVYAPTSVEAVLMAVIEAVRKETA